VDSCVDLVGSRQHGVAAKSKATGCLTDRLLNAYGILVCGSLRHCIFNNDVLSENALAPLFWV